MDDIPGFSDANITLNDTNEETNYKKKQKKSGGFLSLGLNQNVLRGLTKRGYKQPTPIQRKTIPLILDGRDVVAMARTGSGKTACFLIPMFEKLKTRSAKTGARALILSPTRELALQTLKFIKELGRFVGLKTTVILGGDSMDDQFSAIHGNPDVIVATPGRFLHVCIEMELKLNSIEYVVFDEADRLFEMGLGEQLTEIVGRLPEARQTVLFSATMPKLLVEFAKAGLNDPVLIRLDVETKIPPELQLYYITVRPDERVAALLVLLKNLIDANQQTIIFAATRHHVEYLHFILDSVEISNTYIYSSLDPSARKINAAKFSSGKSKVLVVTDVAARGIDIPQLDNVINFNFPAKSKLFVHRVGRCARAGRSGTAYSLVTPDEFAYLIDLHLFLGRDVDICSLSNKNGSIGKIPQALVEEQQNSLMSLHETRVDLVNLRKVSENAYQQYSRSRPAASLDSNRKIKELNLANCSIHPLFKGAGLSEVVEAREEFLDKMKNYRPNSTIFEICAKNKSQEYQIMKQKKQMHKSKIEAHHQRNADKEILNNNDKDSVTKCTLDKSSEEQIGATFKEIIMPKKRKIDDLYKKDRKRLKIRDDDNYIQYTPSDKNTEAGLSINTFNQDANKVQFDITGDSDEMLKRQAQMKRWDRKKKKMVAVEDKRVGKIKTESGVWIPATYKTNRYQQWKQKAKVEAENDDEGMNEKEKFGDSLKPRWFKHNKKVAGKQRRSEIKSVDEVLKARKIAEKKKSRMKKGKKKGTGKRKK